eukprot:gnl/TRDRNA2_/TRDRNA2_59322_c0_seq1.p1 gnl/TRDRNA2_/TRDRNA2_59322_c0~~gnl/TRDRNA2_/TRDRNA2_59322_c0_seq1.p1  ORF type:complete len:396 (+),score=78.32 gnl/TRDRNA2_/TRDRNA2_59322_c0_seq1:61-1248(+)
MRITVGVVVLTFISSSTAKELPLERDWNSEEHVEEKSADETDDPKRKAQPLDDADLDETTLASLGLLRSHPGTPVARHPLAAPRAHNYNLRSHLVPSRSPLLGLSPSKSVAHRRHPVRNPVAFAGDESAAAGDNEVTQQNSEWSDAQNIVAAAAEQAQTRAEIARVRAESVVLAAASAQQAKPEDILKLVMAGEASSELVSGGNADSTLTQAAQRAVGAAQLIQNASQSIVAAESALAAAIGEAQSRQQEVASAQAAEAKAMQETNADFFAQFWATPSVEAAAAAITASKTAMLDAKTAQLKAFSQATESVAVARKEEAAIDALEDIMRDAKAATAKAGTKKGFLKEERPRVMLVQTFDQHATVRTAALAGLFVGGTISFANLCVRRSHNPLLAN